MVRGLPLFVTALWWGSLTTIGFGVVPLLFANLPTKALAGGMAAHLFSVQTWLSSACALLLLMVMRAPRWQAAVGHWSTKATPSVVAGMLLALLSEFAVAPHIVARDNLALWHSLGSGMYLLQWLCAGWVLWTLTQANAQPPTDQV